MSETPRVRGPYAGRDGGGNIYLSTRRGIDTITLKQAESLCLDLAYQIARERTPESLNTERGDHA